MARMGGVKSVFNGGWGFLNGGRQKLSAHYAPKIISPSIMQKIWIFPYAELVCRLF